MYKARLWNLRVEYLGFLTVPCFRLKGTTAGLGWGSEGSVCLKLEASGCNGALVAARLLLWTGKRSEPLGKPNKQKLCQLAFFSHVGFDFAISDTL